MSVKPYCRLCVEQTADLLWVFDTRFETNNHLKDLIFKTTGVEINETDAISQKICTKCGENVVKLYEFRTRSQRNDQFLKEQHKRTQKRTPHRSILNIFQKYPRILIPDLEICLSENISPVVEMRMDEVENHFKSKHLDFDKHVLQVLRQEKQKQRALNAALKSKNTVLNSLTETVSPISIKYRQDKSSYEIVQRKDDEESTHSNSSLSHLGKHRKRLSSDSEQSCSSKKSRIKDTYPGVNPIPNRRQSIGPIEISIRQGPSDLDVSLLEALEKSENQTLPLTPTKRTPATISNISNILIKPANESIPINHNNTKQLNQEIVPKSTTFKTVANDLNSTSCDNDYLRINNGSNSTKHILPNKNGIVDSMKESVVSHPNKQFIPNQSHLDPTITKPQQLPKAHTNRNEYVVPNSIAPRSTVLQPFIPNPNHLPSTVTRPGPIVSNNISTVEHLLIPTSTVQPFIQNPNQHPPTLTKPIVPNSIADRYTIAQPFIPTSNHFSSTVTGPIVSNIISTVVQPFIPNPNQHPPTLTKPILPNSIADRHTIDQTFIPTSNHLSSTVTTPIVSNNISTVERHLVPTSTVVQPVIPNPNQLPSTLTKPIVSNNINTVKYCLVPTNTLVQPSIPNPNHFQFVPNPINFYPVLQIANKFPESLDVSFPVQIPPNISLVPNTISGQNDTATSKTVEVTKCSSEPKLLHNSNNSQPKATSSKNSVSIQLIPKCSNSKATSATVERIPEPITYEVDEFLNPIRLVSDPKIAKSSNNSPAPNIKSNLSASLVHNGAKYPQSKQTNTKYSCLKSKPTSKTVEANPDPYVFEFDEYLDPIKMFKKCSKDQKILNNSSTPNIESEFTCNFCRESFASEELRQLHLETCRIKKETERPVYVLLENIDNNVHIKSRYHKAFRDCTETNSNDIIEILDDTDTEEKPIVLELNPQVEIKNSNFPNIDYKSKPNDIMKLILASDKNESPADQNSQTDLLSDSPEIDDHLSNLKLFPKKDSIYPQRNGHVLFDNLKSYIHLYRIPVSIGYKERIELTYNFEDPPKRNRTSDDWNNLPLIDIVKQNPITEMSKNISPTEKETNSEVASTLPVVNSSASLSTVPNMNPVQQRESVITSVPSNEESLPDLGNIELLDVINADPISTSNDSSIFDSTNSNQLYPNELLNNPQTQINYAIQPEQISPNINSKVDYQRTYRIDYPTTAGERINGLETSYFENYMNHQQSYLKNYQAFLNVRNWPNLNDNQRIMGSKTWLPTMEAQQNPAVRGPPPPYSMPHQIEKQHNSNTHPYNYKPNQLVTNYAYTQNMNNPSVCPNVTITNRTNYSWNGVPISNVPVNMSYNNCQMTDNNYNGGAQINSAITQTSDIANNASTIRVRPLSDLK